MQHVTPSEPAEALHTDALRTEERRTRIIDALRQNDAVTVADLSAWLNVSDVTIRKDLQNLEDQGYLTRVRGGAVFSGRGQLELRFAARQQICLEEKRRIALRAVEFVQPGSTIYLDASSTVFQMTRLLRNLSGLTVVTTGLYAALELSFALDVTTIVVGGILRRQSSNVVDLLSPEMLRRLHVDVAFLGCRGFTVEHGMMESDLREAQLKRGMAKVARQVIGLADHTKIGEVFIASSLLPDEMHTLITDQGVPAEQRAAIVETGLRLEVV